MRPLSDWLPHDWRQRLYIIIFEADTREGRLFDIALLIAIVLSVLTVIVSSIPAVRDTALLPMAILEWFFTLLFTAEYIARLLSAHRPLRYALSFYGIIDLLAILPTYLAILVPELHGLIDVRLLRLMRVFRILKLTAYVNEAGVLSIALYNARRKVLVFLGFISIIVVIFGTLMHIIEGPEHGFTSIPVGIYWAIVTLTTTGYGDVVPVTGLGKAITGFVMLLGYSVIAIPTGIMGAEIHSAMRKNAVTTRTCQQCLTEGHDADASYCKHCGSELAPYQSDTPTPPEPS
ncbi:ion transporter [Pandoraea fibrosis]|uniref:Ion transporter n=1 Tax=Pandoraea fibrosis TaxID=1891094 RepID=A0ABX6HP38_9BURK|nr:ion transporter [Pandoraea fibrosis]QHE93800.1 ion transporter [Pandoraea fibrosis]QHF12638.1 ion transporter [Pandoraea fibrosis]